MTDPVTITATTIATLAFTKLVDSGAGELGKKFTQAAIDQMEQLRQKIWEKLRGKPEAEKALKAVEETGSQEELKRLAGYLQDEMEVDQQFATELKALATEINAGKLRGQMVQNNHDNSTGWQNTIEGKNVYLGNINVHGK
jgi:small-conductance mechanosensitive channel